MHLTRKIFAFCLSAVLLLSMSACAHISVFFPRPTEESTVTPTMPTEPEDSPWVPYDGSSKNYVYYHRRQRERLWEEDILYMADSYLADYAQLTHFNSRIELPGDVEYSNEFYNEALRGEFIAAVNGLIPRLSELSNVEIRYEMQKIVAMLGDAHASIPLPESRYFPLLLLPIYQEDGTVGFYANQVPEEYPELIYGKLEAINDIPLEEIIENMRPYLSYENEHWVVSLLSAPFSSEYIIWKDFLQIAGVVGENDKTARFRFLTESGESSTVELKAYTTAQIAGVDLDGTHPATVYPRVYGTWDSKNYWFETLEEEQTIYIRINRFIEESGYSFMTMGNEILNAGRKTEWADKVVIDLRSNFGGYHFPGYDQLISVLQRLELRSVYVLIDGSTFSNGVIMASTIKRAIPGAVLVGQPAGQPTSFFAGMYDGDYVTPNYEVLCRIPTAWYITLPGYEEEALLPDITVTPTLEDYKNNVDTIWEAVREMP